MKLALQFLSYHDFYILFYFLLEEQINKHPDDYDKR